jgi:rifampicin phosphotransferase
MCLLSLSDAIHEEPAEIGAKAHNLAKLRQAGFPVPEGWIIPTRVFHSQLAAWGMTTTCLEDEIVKKIQTGKLLPELQQQLAELPDLALAVRSSAAVEDGDKASYSGLFTTILDAQGQTQLENALRQVWASAFAPAVLAYHKKISGTGDIPTMAVLLMPMVEATAAGVAFSAHPINGDPFIITISAASGSGTAVVGGNAAVDSYQLDWRTLAPIAADINKREHAVLDPVTLTEIGRLTREVDGFFDKRIDIEFAVTPEGIRLLQARPIVGLPAYFPDDPRTQNRELFCCHCERTGPLSPYARGSFEAGMRTAFPPPPWPWEIEEFLFSQGRLFAYPVANPEAIDCPETPWEDRGFITRMLALANPEAAFQDWYAYANLLYGKVIPKLRLQAENILRLTREQLRDLTQEEFASLWQGVIKLDAEAMALYLAVSYPTYETLRRVDILIRDCLQLSWQEAQQLALTMIQGAPKLTHLRDAEVVQAAASGNLDNVILHWGYSYLCRDELLDLWTWRSWREDPAPLETALANLGKLEALPAISERVTAARSESDARFVEITEKIKAGSEVGRKHADVFAACVQAARRFFPLKDDRDLVMSHAQSAVRWVLLEAGRRLTKVNCITETADLALLLPEEMLAGITGNCHIDVLREVVTLRREEQHGYARYILPPTAATTTDEGITAEGTVYKGLPASAGIAEGAVRIIATDRPEEIAQLQPGEILWLQGEAKVGWTIYFPLIAGLVYTAGNWLCHETNLCRELGIPAVVGMKAVKSITTGDHVRIDGGKGTMEIVR